MPRTNREELGGRLEDLLDISHGLCKSHYREGGEWVESNEHSRDVAREPRAQGDCTLLSGVATLAGYQLLTPQIKYR